MHLTKEIKEYLDRSILCWLATVDTDGMPNVSPKEMFSVYGDDRIIIANIASPQTVRNIRECPKACLSFIDVWVQKGFQLKGQCRIVREDDAEYIAMKGLLSAMAGDRFAFSTITEFSTTFAKPIIAPSYLLFPETTEQQQIESSKKAYLKQTNGNV